MWKISNKETQHQEMVATTSFARQMMDGEEGSWKVKEVLDSGVWKFGRWKKMSEQLGGQQAEVG